MSKNAEVGLPTKLLNRLAAVRSSFKEAARPDIIYIGKTIQESKQPGIVIECGSGNSTVFLSLICAHFGRKLYSFDTFKGCPDDGGIMHVYPHLKRYGYYRPGMISKSKHKVENMLKEFGCGNTCTLIEGDVKDTLSRLNEPVVLAFLDMDLIESTKCAVKYIWPWLPDGGMIFTHEAVDMDCCRIFFDDAWWKENLGCKSPGYIGSGCGLPLTDWGCSLGYAIKISSPAKLGWYEYAGLELKRRERGG